MQYLWQFYLLIAVIFLQGLFVGFSSKNGKTIFIWLCFFELAFIAGFRAWHIGNDTQSYIHAFILSGSYSELFKTHMEAGYLLYNRLLSFFTADPQMLLLTTSVFIIGTWLRTLYKYSIALTFSMVLFVILGYDMTLTMIRQEIAMCIVFLSIPFIIRRQLIPFLLMVVLASSFHSSAVFAVGLYLLYPLDFKVKYVLIALLVALGIFFFLAPILDEIFRITGRYESYMGRRLLGEETKLASLAKTTVQFAITGFCYISYKYVLPKREVKSLLNEKFLLWCSLVALCVQFVSIRGTVLERLVLYFSSFNFVSIPYFVHRYPKAVRMLVAVGLVGCFILYKSIIFVYRPEWNHVLPFEFCF